MHTSSNHCATTATDPSPHTLSDEDASNDSVPIAVSSNMYCGYMDYIFCSVNINIQ